MVKVFYAPLNHKNITKFLLEQAAKTVRPPDYSGILYLAPTSIKAKDAQKLFYGIARAAMSGAAWNCYIPPEMSTIGIYCKKVYSACGGKKLLARHLIPVIVSRLSGRGLGFSSIIADFIGSVKRLYPGRDIESIRLEFEGIFKELNTPEYVAGAVTDVFEIFEKYRLFIAEHGLVDEEDVLLLTGREFLSRTTESRTCKCEASGLPSRALLSSWGSEGEYPSLVLDGFYDPAACELDVMGALIRNSEDVYIGIPYEQRFYGLTSGYIKFLRKNFDVEEIYLNDGNEFQVTSNEFNEKDSENLSPVTPRSSPSFVYPVPQKATNESAWYGVYCSYPDVEGEVEGIARNIKSLFVSGKINRLEEIAVVFPDINKYAGMTERIFRRYGIPCDISSNKTLGKMRPFLDLLCLVGSVSEDYPRLKFSQFLSSAYFTKIPESLRKWIPPLSPRSGIISGKNAWLDFVSGGSEVFDKAVMNGGPAVEKDLRWVFKKMQSLENIKNRAMYGDFAEALKKILIELGFPGAMTDPLAKKIFETTLDILDQISYVGFLISDTATITEFEDLLIHLLHSSFLETEGSGVRVMSFSDAYGLTPGYLYSGGLVDGDMPKRQDMDYILPDNVKKRAGLLHLDKYNELQKFMFASVTGCCEHIHLSYPAAEGDTVFLPSSFLYPGEEIKEKIFGIFSKEEALIRNGREPLLNYISEIKVNSPAQRHAAFSKGSGGEVLRVTDVDAYRSCPRRFFIEKRLKLTPVEVKEYEIEATALGIIIHKIMEQLMQKPFKDVEQLKERAGAVTENILEDRKMDSYWKTLIRDTFIEILPQIYEKELEIREAGYVATEVEMPVAGEPLEGIKLKGKIDRIDRIGGEVQIIDYKTGAAGLNCSQALMGNENLQLFLYAAVLKSRGYNVKRVGIYSLKDISVKWCPPKRRTAKSKVEPGRHIDDYITASLKFLEDAVSGIRKGDFRAKPLNDYICRSCHEYAFCPYIQQ